MNAEKAERLLREMRERALEAPAAPMKPDNRAKIEEFKKLYFNAGRWAGGSRDWVARQAFERVNQWSKL